VAGGAGRRLAYLTLPKARSAAEVRDMIACLREVERAGGLGREIPIHVLIETHGALQEVFEIAAIPSVEVLDFGLMDFVSDHHGAIPEACMRSPGQFEHALLRRAKAEIAAAALGQGVVPSHNVTIDLKNPEQARQDALRARQEFGFLRMWSVHPSQIEPIIEAMRPTAPEIERAARLLLVAEEKDWAPIELDGQLFDRASYRYHWGVLERAHRAGSSLPEAVSRAFFSDAPETAG
jgi:citrate lyase subunit beta/citryl-CoA lyase